jgi:hypothetical protein
MFINNRVIQKDNAVFTDISALLSDPYSGLLAWTVVVAEDALYIGSDMPFNHRFLMLNTKNTVAGTISVYVWDGTAFTACEDVQDFTSVNGIPFSRNGLIRFALPANTGWGKVYDSSDISELSTLKSKANYWAKITFSAAFVFELEYVGFRFARDADLNTYYRDLLKPDMMKAFNSGQPMQNWDSVHIMAAEEIIKDLRADEIIFSPNQILDPETFTDAACHKLAFIAFSQLRNTERKDDARELYNKAMAKRVFNVDVTGNGRLESVEKVSNWRLKRV